MNINSSSQYNLIFVANLGTSFLSDMAVDDISPTIGCQSGGRLPPCLCTTCIV